MTKFCPQCGKTETQDNLLVGILCKNCFSQSSPLLKDYKEFKLVICPDCKSYLHKNKWHPALSSENDVNVKKIIKKILPEKLKFNPHTKINSMEIKPKLTKNTSIRKQTIETSVFIQGTLNDTLSKENYLLQVKETPSTCNLCKLRHSQYYEAIIQIRPKTPKLLNFINEDINHNSNVFVTKSEEKKFGYNLYITSKKYLSSLISKTKSKFDVETKISKTLYGKKEGQDVYRITALIRLKE